MTEETKELLKLAAKAAGNKEYTEYAGWIDIEPDGNRRLWWNPADNDGDSRRLQVALGIDLLMHNVNHFCTATYGGAYTAVIKFSEYNGNKYLSARMAILKVAAGIGKNMP